MNRTTATVVALLMLGVAGLWAARLVRGGPPGQPAPLPSASDVGLDPEAPDLVVRTQRGDVSLSAQRGKVVLLDFWATWCPPCRKSAPRIQALHRRYGDQGLVVMGPSFDKADKVIPPFAKTAGLTYPVGRMRDETAADAFGVAALPTVVLIDRKGTLRWRAEGYGPRIERELAWRIPALLKE